MSRRIQSITFALLMVASNSAMAADYWHSFWTDWHRNNCWMEPFIYPDRASVGNMFEAQISKGWQLQCLLGEPHFDADSSQLSPAGMSKLRTIFSQNPVQFRNVFVERAADDELTTKRLIAAQRAVAGMVHTPGTEVLVSEMPLIGSPAEQVNGVNNWLVKYEQGIPVPVPKAFQNNADSGSGSGSSGSP